MLLHRECENKGVTCNKLATAMSQSSENKVSHKLMGKQSPEDIWQDDF